MGIPSHSSRYDFGPAGISLPDLPHRVGVRDERRETEPGASLSKGRSKSIII